MTLLGKLRAFLRREQMPTPEEDAAAEQLKARFRERCANFRRLLSANKQALEALAEVEECLRGTRPYGMNVVRSVVTRAGAGVFQMIQRLNALSGNRYADLSESFTRISEQMEALLVHRTPPVSGALVLPLEQITLADLPSVGGKMANLGEMKRHVGLTVPDGFAVTASACALFMQHDGLQEEIDRRMQAAEGKGTEALFTLSASLQELVRTAALPQTLIDQILEQVAGMKARAKGPLRLALRSSAVGEDALGVSFAGQFHSELNVQPDDVLDVWREIVAGKYSVTAMTYRFERGIPDDAVPMCVGVLAMVNAVAGGVAYSRNPVAGGTPGVLINAVPGLPVAVVDGSFSPDTFLISHSHTPEILERHIAEKPFRCICDPVEGIQRIPLLPEEGRKACISDTLARQVARLAVVLEEYYGEAQDVEWALHPDGELVILQSRPLSLGETGEAAPSSAVPEACALPEPLLAGGVSVSAGVGRGKAVVVRRDADMLSFPEGAVLVTERAQPRWATLLSRAAAMVTEAGGAAGHLACVAREYGLPAVFGLKGAVKVLQNAGDITVDADAARIFAGYPEGLAPAAPRPNLMEGSPVQERLKQVAQLMVPLSLLDPSSPQFAPEYCRTLHDIIRFCHEKSVDCMFGEEGDFAAHQGKQLKAGAVLQYWVIDIDDGFIEPVRGSVVDLSNIRSAPMLSLWEGMTAVPWAGPPATNAAGFMSVVFESTMNRDLEVSTATRLNNRNFLMISSTFMNLQARFGYHFCTVEAQAGDSAHENFVSFQFKGGAADGQRRILRAHMVRELLEDYGFRVDVREDALFAVAEGYDAPETLLRVMLLGYLLIHTRQVDMIMNHEGRAKELRSRLERDMARLAAAARARRDHEETAQTPVRE